MTGTRKADNRRIVIRHTIEKEDRLHRAAFFTPKKKLRKNPAQAGNASAPPPPKARVTFDQGSGNAVIPKPTRRARRVMQRGGVRAIDALINDYVERGRGNR